jgi:hypothetical protein
MNNGSPDPYGMGMRGKIWGVIKRLILQMGSDKIILDLVFHNPFTVKLPDRGSVEVLYQPKRGTYLVYRCVQGK